MKLANDFVLFEEEGNPVEYELIYMLTIDGIEYALLLEWDPFKKEEDLNYLVGKISITQGEIDGIDCNIDDDIEEIVLDSYERDLENGGTYESE